MPRMGMMDSPPAGLSGALFSRVQLRVLQLLLGNPGRTFHAAEIIRLAQSGSGAVQRELEKLTRAGIVAVTRSGNRKLYQANHQSPIFAELSGIIVKTVGLVDPLRKALKPFTSKIEFAFVYGSVARGSDTARSDIDLMILGHELSYGDIFMAMQRAEKQIARTINPNLMSVDEWRKKAAGRNAFVINVLKQPKIFIVGSEHALPGVG